MATSKINKDYTYKDFTVTTTSNPNVSPFGAYASPDIGLSGYVPVSAFAIGHSTATTGCTLDEVYNNLLNVYTAVPRAVVIRVLYAKS